MNTGKTKASFDSVALAASSGHSGQRRETGRDGKKSQPQELFCRYCKKENHVIEDCFNLKNKRKNEAGGRSFAGSNDTNGTDAVLPAGGGSSQSPTSPSSDNRNNQEGQPIWFTYEEIHRLRSLLQQQPSNTVSQFP
ncbi:unnamed protein product [Linum trigynum]